LLEIQSTLRRRIVASIASNELIVSIHQPAYLPWLGYLDRIAASERFVFLDTVQFEKNSFTNRNLIKTHNGELWLTIPVLSKGHTSSSLHDLKIDNSQDWRSRHLRSIEQNYKKAPYFEDRFPKLVAVYEPEDSLSDLCFRHLQFWAGEFKLGADIVRASDLGGEGKKSDLILSLCMRAGATTYLSGSYGREYLDEVAFAEAGVELKYHQFVPQPYPQLFGEFFPTAAALDYWMNVGEPSKFREAP